MYSNKRSVGQRVEKETAKEHEEIWGQKKCSIS